MFSQENLSMMMYFNKLRKFWDELLLLRPLPKCVVELEELVTVIRSREMWSRKKKINSYSS